MIGFVVCVANTKFVWLLCDLNELSSNVLENMKCLTLLSFQHCLKYRCVLQEMMSVTLIQEPQVLYCLLKCEAKQNEKVMQDEEIITDMEATEVASKSCRWNKDRQRNKLWTQYWS